MRSMTGYGQARWQGGGRRIAVEVRGVNQRFLDVRFNLPREYQVHEDELRKLVQDEVSRGKIDVVVNRAGTSPLDFDVEINEPLARAMLDSWRRLQKRLRVKGELDISHFAGRGEFVRVVEKRRAADSDLPSLKRLLRQALKAFDRARQREGAALARDMRVRVAHLRRIEAALRRRSAEVAPEMARRLADRLAALLGERQIAPERVVQEAALLADKADVTEELVRLASHLERLAKLLGDRGSIGRPIDFLLQEVHREINTIASKSADLEVTNLTLEARTEVEKLREQAQNVE
jgi:uncharacterized protein (TIGR00255 family)